MDELAKARRSELGWSNMMFGMREGNPRGIVTTTPKPVPILKQLLKARAFERLDHLAIEDLAQVRTGRQEINAEMIDDLPGALWTRAMIDKARETRKLPRLQPGGGCGRSLRRADDERQRCERDRDCGDWQGRRRSRLRAGGPFLQDVAGWLRQARLRRLPRIWCRSSCRRAQLWRRDGRVGDQAGRPDREVHRGRGLTRQGAARRADLGSLREGHVTHAAPDMLELEDQQCQMATDGYMGEGSPDRVDALVWGLSELLVTWSTYDHSMSWVGNVVSAVIRSAVFFVKASSSSICLSIPATCAFKAARSSIPACARVASASTCVVNASIALVSAVSSVCIDETIPACWISAMMPAAARMTMIPLKIVCGSRRHSPPNGRPHGRRGLSRRGHGRRPPVRIAKTPNQNDEAPEPVACRDDREAQTEWLAIAALRTASPSTER